MSSPLSQLDNLVFQALYGCYAVIEPLGDSANIILLQRGVADVRAQLALGQMDLRGSVAVVPDASSVDFEWSSASIRFSRGYRIIFGIGGLDTAKARDIEWGILRAMLNLSLRLTPSGDGELDVTAIAPLTLENVTLESSDPELRPVGDPQEVVDVCAISVIGFAAIADVKVQ